MRSMLISFIFFCSLTQFAIADPPLTPTVDREKLNGCGSIYVCYAPETCTDPNKKGFPMEQHFVKELDANTEVTIDCPAIIRYHVYSQSWIYVWIESFQPKEIVDSIEFLHKDVSRAVHTQFSCEIDANGNKIGKFEAEEKSSDGTEMDKINCTFDVKNSGEEPIFKRSGTNYLHIRTSKGTEKKETKFERSAQLTPNSNTNCDPLNFYFNSKTEKEFAKTQLYEKVQYEPGKYFCKENYKIQYRIDGSNDRYKVADKIECDTSQFKINDEYFGKDDSLDIRCFIETKFLCKYSVVPVSGQPPVQGPDDGPTTESKLKCPDAQPHLVIVNGGKEKVVLKPEFKCEKSGSNTIWTVNSNKLTKTGPPAYCTRDAGENLCNLVLKIPDNAVLNGFLDTNGLPKCHPDGTLKTVVHKHAVTNSRCDFSTGSLC